MTDVVGAVLAAGKGTRFDPAERAAATGDGRSDGESPPDVKLLARLDGEPIVRRAASSLAVSEIDRVVAIVGHEDEAVAACVSDVVDEVREHSAYETGQAASVALAARRARAYGADAICYLPGDVPCVDPATTNRVLEAIGADGHPDAVVPTHAGQRGHPVCFASSQFEALSALSGDVGGRALFDEIDVTRVPVDDPWIRRDVDTVSDLAALRLAYESRS
ncbi:nucleotidyltransferase family protein [Halovivax gelatinilyticus]|uniref:nucleotidyltransferase family protein n=1 Tax=Halovivax gelatinilyticus TaxID=2961597 RepID=UPI0020CA7C97|nr:NTP transferase domain-containing protein [Halovivax gelatinilyticus]